MHIIKKRTLSIFLIVTVCACVTHAQSATDAVTQERELQKDMSFLKGKKLKDDREVVGIAAFKSDTESPFVGLVTEKVVEVFRNSNRFIIVDRTHMDKVNEEMEYQKREEFIGKDVADQESNLAAKKIVNGTITKIPVYRMKNGDGSVRGYKASVAFQLKVDDVETGQTTQAVSFEGKASDECISAQAAVQMAMNSLEGSLDVYVRTTFPLTAKVMKILTERNGSVLSVLIKAGKKHGVKVGDKFTIKAVTEIDGEEMTDNIGMLTVTSLKDEAFSECKVDKSAGQPLYEKIKSNAKVRCELIVK